MIDAKQAVNVVLFVVFELFANLRGSEGAHEREDLVYTHRVVFVGVWRGHLLRWRRALFFPEM